MLTHVDPCDSMLRHVMNLINRWLIRSLVRLSIQSQIPNPRPQSSYQPSGWSYCICIYMYIYLSTCPRLSTRVRLLDNLTLSRSLRITSRLEVDEETPCFNQHALWESLVVFKCLLPVKMLNIVDSSERVNRFYIITKPDNVGPL